MSTIKELYVTETGRYVRRLASSLRLLAHDHDEKARGAAYEHHARAATTLTDAATMLETFFEASVELMIEANAEIMNRDTACPPDRPSDKDVRRG